MTDREPTLARRSRIECLEERVVLSAQPVANLVVDSFLTDQVEIAVEQLAPSIADAHVATGLDHVQANYGFMGDGQTVAVIDTGIAWDHYALGGGLGAEYRVVGGWDFAENDSNPYDDGPAGFHGTHVAGIIGSTDAQHQGVASGADLVSLRVFDDMGRATFEWVEQALQWVHENRDTFENPITTVNMSLGAQWNSQTVPDWAILEDEFAQLKNDGIFIAVAAGNSFQSYGTEGLSYPAVSSHVVPVASVGADGSLSDFSQRNERVIAAPGESIQSTIPNHIYGSEQPSDKFLALSGTSMATPYLAGASVLVREAMGFAGYDSIDQDVLYEHFRQTADEIWDSTTQSNYYRLNLQNAIDAILVDRVGDSSAAATHLGGLIDSQSIEGTIESNSDRDFYSFTASANGTASLAFETTGQMKPTWELPESARTLDDGTIRFDVVAGQKYDFGIASSNGIGHYTIDLALDNTQAIELHDIGIILDHHLEGIELDGAVYYQVTASRTGLFTTVAEFQSSRGAGQLHALDSQFNVIGAAQADGDNAQLTLDVNAGDQFLVRVSGEAAQVDLHMINLVARTGSHIDVFGTNGNDRFAVKVGDQLEIQLNGIEYRFDLDEVSQLTVSGREGHDHLQFVGSGQDDTLRLRGDFIRVENSEITIVAHHLEATHIDTGEGYDRVYVLDDGGDQTAVVGSEAIAIDGNDYSHRVEGAEYARLFGGAGVDSALVNVTEHAARFVGGHWQSSLLGNEFEAHLVGFDSVHAISHGAEGQFAFLYGTRADNQFIASNDRVSLQGNGYKLTAEGFTQVSMVGRGGVDTVSWSGVGAPELSASSGGWNALRGDGYQYFVQRGIQIESFGEDGATLQSAYYRSGHASYQARSISEVTSELVESIDQVHAETSRLSYMQSNVSGSQTSPGVFRAMTSSAPRHDSELLQHWIQRTTTEQAVDMQVNVDMHAVVMKTHGSEQVLDIDNSIDAVEYDLTAIASSHELQSEIELATRLSSSEASELGQLDDYFENLSNETETEPSHPQDVD